MFNRKKVSYSADKNIPRGKKLSLSNWINDYEIEAYATQEMKEELKELLLDVYNRDKDVRQHFFDKYITELSEIIKEQSNPKYMDCLNKDIPFDNPKKSEFKQFIENRNNKLLEKENNKKYKNLIYNNYRSEDKKIKKNSYFDDEDEYGEINNSCDEYNNNYLNEKKRNNSKIRDYAIKRYQIKNKYNNIFNDNDNDNKNNTKQNKINLDNDEKDNIKIKNEGFRKSNMNNQRKIKYKDCNINENLNIPRLLIMHKNKKQNGKEEIKIYSNNNKKQNEQEKLYNGTNKISYSNKGKINLKNIFSNNKENTSNNNNYNKEEILKNEFNELLENIDETAKNYKKYEDEYILENGDEIKKVNISGVNYKLSGYGPEKMNISEEIELDNLGDQNNIRNVSENPNNQSNVIHKKIIIKKNLGDGENSLVQKIEKDIKTNKSHITGINIPKHVFKKIDENEKLKQLINYNEEDKYNNLYEISYFKENEIYGMNPFENISKNKIEKTYNASKYKSYNERKRLKMKNNSTKGYKINYKINNTEENNKENKRIENNKERNYRNIYKNSRNNNNLNEVNISQKRKKEDKLDIKDYKYSINISRKNRIVDNLKTENDNLNKNEKRVNFYKNINIKFNEIKKYNINDNIKKEPPKIHIPGVRRKRFHRVVNSEI